MINQIEQNAERCVECSYLNQHDQYGLSSFPDYHRSYDPLQYPLLFPYGSDGWHYDIRSKANNKNCTLIQFIIFHISNHFNRVNIFHCQRKLFLEYLVDQYCKAEMGRFRFLNLNQLSIRADLYLGVIDFLNSGDINNTGCAVILPATFT